MHYQRDRRSFWYFGSLMFTMTLVLIYYLSFKLGASQDPGSQAPHEVRDRDYFFLWSFSAWGVWAALGLLFVWESIAALIGSETVKVGRESVSMPKKTSLRMSSPVLLLAAVPLFANWKYASRAGHHDTRDFAADILNSVEPYGVLVTVGDNDTFPLWYAQEVEGIRRDDRRQHIVAQHGLVRSTDHPSSGVFDYDAAKGPPSTATNMDEADVVTDPYDDVRRRLRPAYYPLDKPMSFSAGDIKATIDPRNLDHGLLQRADLFVLRMIQDAWPQRPVYFARTSGGYARSLGLGVSGTRRLVDEFDVDTAPGRGTTVVAVATAG